MSAIHRCNSTPSMPAARGVGARREHLFFGGMTMTMLIAVLVAFSNLWRRSTGTTFEAAPAARARSSI